jgi:ribosomal protein S15P/S13E
MNTPDDDFIEAVGNTEYAKIKSVDIDRLLRICDDRKAALAEQDEIIENKSRVIVGWENHVFKKDEYNKKLLDENIDYQNENAAQREQIAALTARIKELTEALEKK